MVYDVVGVLGRGGTGVVELAVRHPNLRREEEVRAPRPCRARTRLVAGAGG